MGIPTAPMVTIAFHDLAESNAASRGMPGLRIIFTPHPVWGKTPEQMYAYLEGNDPVSHKPLMPELIGALTKPLTPEESKAGSYTPSIGPATFVDTAEGLQKYYMDNGMTDFMPIVIPTEEKVDAMLKGTSHSPDEQVGKLTPAQGAFPAWSFNVRQVAINAVMSGASPDYFPTLLALAGSGQSALFSSTNSLVYAAVINGPIRNKLNMNYGIGAMGPFSQPNSNIGRGWGLLSKNLCNGGLPGQTYEGSQGNVINYSNLIIPENEEASPYEPLHVQKGFKKEENVVSLFFGFGIQQAQGGWGLGIKPVPHYEEAMACNCVPFATIFGAFIVMDPLVANGLVDRGYKKKEDLAAWLQKNATDTVGHLKSCLFSRPPMGAAASGLTDDSVVPKWGRAEAFNFAVCGGETNPYHQIANMSYRMSVSIDKWV